MPEPIEQDDIAREIASLLHASACAKLQALAERPDLGPLLRAFCRRVAGNDDLAGLADSELDEIANTIALWIERERDLAKPRLVHSSR